MFSVLVAICLGLSVSEIGNPNVCLRLSCSAVTTASVQPDLAVNWQMASISYFTDDAKCPFLAGARQAFWGREKMMEGRRERERGRDKEKEREKEGETHEEEEERKRTMETDREGEKRDTWRGVHRRKGREELREEEGGEEKKTRRVSGDGLQGLVSAPGTLLY